MGSRAVSTSQPFFVTTSVCSNCADRLPSAVTLVQPSGQVVSFHVPTLIMGSMVNTCDWPVKCQRTVRQRLIKFQV